MKKIVEIGSQVTNVRKRFEIDVEYAMGGYSSLITQNTEILIKTKFGTEYKGKLTDYVDATKEGEQDSLIVKCEGNVLCKVGIHDISYMEVY